MLIRDTRISLRNDGTRLHSNETNLVTRGWLPWRIAENSAIIRWIEPLVSDADERFFSEPIFEWCVARARARIPRPRELDTDLSVLRAAASRLPEVLPAGIIFHVSRCGSTLVSNALSVASEVVVLSEVPAVDQMMDMAESSEPYWAETGRQGLRDLVSVFAHHRGALPRTSLSKRVSEERRI